MAHQKCGAELGRQLYTDAAALMSARHQGKPRFPLSAEQKQWLRPFYGNLVDKVAVTYNARLMDYLGSFVGKALPGESAAQTYGYDIYVAHSYAPGDFDQVMLLGHELQHANQFEQYGRSLSDFGYHYFRSWARNGFKYSRNGMEEEASSRETQVSDQLGGLRFSNTTNEPIHIAMGYYDRGVDQWRSQGWYKVDAGQEKRIFSGPAGLVSGKNLFYFVQADSGMIWAGDTDFLVHPTNAFGPLLRDLSVPKENQQGSMAEIRQS